MTEHRRPRALLVEDDPVSAAFLEAALGRVPMQVDVAHRCAQARALAAGATYDLFVFDANLPDGRGDALLRDLRAAGAATPAIAHTAAREGDEHERLLLAGFREVLVKPLSAAETAAAARLALGMESPLPRAAKPDPALPLWDDRAALQALLGDRGHLLALRGLFRPELSNVHRDLAAAVDAGDHATLRSHLHRLRASCGFVGAARLGDAAARLSEGDPRAGWAAFDAVLRSTLDQFPAG